MSHSERPQFLDDLVPKGISTMFPTIADLGRIQDKLRERKKTATGSVAEDLDLVDSNLTGLRRDWALQDEGRADWARRGPGRGPNWMAENRRLEIVGALSAIAAYKGQGVFRSLIYKPGSEDDLQTDQAKEG